MKYVLRITLTIFALAAAAVPIAAATQADKPAPVALAEEATPYDFHWE